MDPNWCKPAAIRDPIVATSFDEVTQALGLQPADFAASNALKEWAKRNKDHKYVPSDLLEAWDLQVKTGL